MSTDWDLLSEHFNGRKNMDEIHTDAADNIFIAWPSVLGQIRKQFGNRMDISVLDYGCGGGAFCEKIRTLGYTKITGMDISAGMIEVARKNYGQHIKFAQGTAETKLSIEQVDVITSIMALQFIVNIENSLRHLVKILKPGGLFIFAVHNPETVSTSLKRKQPVFSDFNSPEKPEKGLIHLGAHAIPIFIRTAAEYDAMMERLGMNKIFEDYPPFTEKFLANYDTDVPDVPEYLILGYRKK